MYQIWDGEKLVFQTDNLDTAYWYRDTFGGSIVAVVNDHFKYEKARFKKGLYHTLHFN